MMNLTSVHSHNRLFFISTKKDNCIRLAKVGVENLLLLFHREKCLAGFFFKRVWCKIVKKHKKEIMVWFSGDRESENESWALHFATSVSPLPADPVSGRERRTSTHWLLVGPWTNLRLSYLFLTDSLFEERSSICRRRRRDSAQRKDHLRPVSHSPSLPRLFV